MTRDDVMAEFLPESEWADYDPVEVLDRMADRIAELTDRLAAVEATGILLTQPSPTHDDS